MRLSEFVAFYQDIEADDKLVFLHSERDKLISTVLQSEPLDFRHYLYRAAIQYLLDYADLAAGDAYRALTLLETYFDPDFSDFHPARKNDEGGIVPWPDDEQAISEARLDMAECLRCLVMALTDLGCLRDAFTYLSQLEELDSELRFFGEEEHQSLRDSILRAQSADGTDVRDYDNASKRKIEPGRLRNLGYARREIYQWNNHEPDRTSSQAVEALNELLEPAAPNLEVRLVELPRLEKSSMEIQNSHDLVSSSSKLKSLQFDRPSTSLQFGIFAKVDIPSSSSILREDSVLTAVRPIDASLCYNCGSSLNEPLSSIPDGSDGMVSCPSCTDCVFCCRACLDIAQTKYHSTTCGNEYVDPLGRDENSSTPSEDLYFLLLARALAMSHAQNMHPLELPETKHLWGDFAQESQSGIRAARTLPVSFQHNIVLPFRLLSILFEQHPSMSPFSPRGLDWYDTWVMQTLYAKFRGVASARQSTWDGKPEIAAVHPLWCLANHSCAPNVEWGWGTERLFWVRERPVWGKPDEDTPKAAWRGIKAGEEILSHYCDIELPVNDRREYMLGSLGGECMCERCRWEAGQEQNSDN